MLHYLIELAVWLLAAYFTGACLGCLFRKLFGNDQSVAAPAAVAAAPAVAAAVMAPRVETPRPVAAPIPARWMHLEGASALARPEVASLIDEAIALNSTAHLL